MSTTVAEMMFGIIEALEETKNPLEHVFFAGAALQVYPSYSSHGQNPLEHADAACCRGQQVVRGASRREQDPLPRDRPAVSHAVIPASPTVCRW